MACRVEAGIVNASSHTFLYRLEAMMAVPQNVPIIERVLRTVLAAGLIVVGVGATGFWRPVSILAGVFLLLTAFVGY
ncbi:MAG: DUF2892 domain-containing protein [Acidobacteria bacterium]|nr:DUF2892 domain-containing protein [Acidobacteriota bacterium]